MYTLVFRIFTFPGLYKKRGVVEDGLPTDSCVQMWPNTSNNHFLSLRLDCISELEFSCINILILTLVLGKAKENRVLLF